MRRLVMGVLLASLAGFASAQDEIAIPGFDGLEPVEGTRSGMAYIDPTADFSVFRRVAILDPFVAFRSNWQRDANRGRGRNINARDMERMRQDIAALFRSVFTERLEAAGFQIVNAADYDVLVLRPAIIDLDIAAPDASAGRSRTFSASAGAASLYLQLVDSVSGDVIGRALDRTVARRAGGQLTWSNRVTNTAEARRAMGRWADILVDFLASYHDPAGSQAAEAGAAAE